MHQLLSCSAFAHVKEMLKVAINIYFIKTFILFYTCRWLYTLTKTAKSPDHKTFSVKIVSTKSNMHSHTWSMKSSVD